MKQYELPTTLWLIVATSTLTPRLMADYPIASHRHLAAPAPLVTKDRVYVYCSDEDESPVQDGYNIPDVNCVSSSDMKNWTDLGPVFWTEKTTKWAKKSRAPSAIEHDGKFWLCFGNGGGVDGKLIGTCKVEGTGGQQTWKNVSCDVADATGVQDHYLKFTGGDGPLFNVDYWKFE